MPWLSQSKTRITQSASGLIRWPVWINANQQIAGLAIEIFAQRIQRFNANGSKITIAPSRQRLPSNACGSGDFFQADGSIFLVHLLSQKGSKSNLHCHTPYSLSSHVTGI